LQEIRGIALAFGEMWTQLSPWNSSPSEGGKSEAIGDLIK
jgi:hypothetical protein